MTDQEPRSEIPEYAQRATPPGLAATFSMLWAAVKDRKETLLGVMMLMMLAIGAGVAANAMLAGALTSMGWFGLALLVLFYIGLGWFCALVLLAVTVQCIMRFHYRQETEFWQAFGMVIDRFWAVFVSGFLILIALMGIGWLAALLQKVLLSIMPELMQIVFAIAWELMLGAFVTAAIAIFYPILIVEKRKIMSAFGVMFRRLGDCFWHFFWVYLVFQLCFKLIPSWLLAGLSIAGLNLNPKMVAEVTFSGGAIAVLWIALILAALFLVGVKALLDAVLWHQSYQIDRAKGSDTQ